jgi:hypothetical protein
MKHFLFLSTAFLFLLFLCTESFAFSVALPNGPLNIKLNTYSIGTDYSDYDNPDNPAYSETGNPASFTGFDYGGAGSGGTNTYGLLSLSSIQTDSNNDGVWENVWSQTAGEYIIGHFWGLSDNQFLYNQDSGQYRFNEIGGYVNLYKSTTGLTTASGPMPVPDYDGLLDSEMPDWNLWNGYGDGDLWVSADFTPGVIIGDSVTTYTEALDTFTLPASGSSNAFLNVTGGLVAALLDTNGFTTGIGTDADLDMSVDITGNQNNSGWNLGEDPIKANVVPEPTTLILFGLGLLGFAGIARKKLNK